MFQVKLPLSEAFRRVRFLIGPKGPLAVEAGRRDHVIEVTGDGA
jgi:hypothetical protein